MGEQLAVCCRGLLVAIAAVLLACAVVDAATDPNDAQGLQNLYTSLNSPPQLVGWDSIGDDPCAESWKGVTCQGSSVVSIQLSGLGLNGTMGYLLNNLVSLKTLDLSNNNIHDQIPYQLPANLTSLNLASNNLSGNLPYSIFAMGSINYLNVSRNMLSQSIGDMLANHSALATLDISFNNITGDLPPSFASLANLSVLHLQNNQLTGSLDVLVSLPLTNLNVANNHFSGWIPQELTSIPDFVYGGNTFDNDPAPNRTPNTSHPRSHGSSRQAPPSGDNDIPGFNSLHRPGHENKNGLSSKPVVGIVVGSLSAVTLLLLAVLFCLRRRNKKEISARRSAGSLLVSSHKANYDMPEQWSKPTTTLLDLNPPPTENVTVERLHGQNGSVKRLKSPSAAAYTVAALQTATDSFSQENLIGEGSLGRVYRAVFPNGKVMAIKKIDNAALNLQEEDNFLEAISNMARLRHPNIVPLAGYCAEHGQRLLVHDCIGNNSLHDMLHYDDEKSKILTWNARVRVALGTARALEYLHEVCLPSVVHKNLKSANILLDEVLNPHLSDCGLAVLIPKTERQVCASQMMVSFGYSAPEFALSGVYTVKSDVYSFGVVMLELLTGRKPLDSSRVRSEQSLVRWATPQLHDIDSLAKMVDPALSGMYPAKSLSRFADIIALCVQPEPEFRPPMSEVVQALVRLMQRASIVTRSLEDPGFTFKVQEHDGGNTSMS